MSNNFNNFGVRLRKLRTENNLNQTDFAKIMGHSKPEVVSYFETGKRFPSIESLSLLAESLHIDLHWLITGQEMDLERALEIVIESTSDEYYKKHADEFSQVSKIALDLEQKSFKGQLLTSRESEALKASREKESILRSRLEMLLSLKLIATTQLKALLENLGKE